MLTEVCVKTLTIAGTIERCPDASENPTRLINVERELALNIFVGESADKLVIV